MRTLVALIFVCTAAAQMANQFEAASIHPNISGRDGSVVDFGEDGRLRVENASLKFLIRSAYGVQADQIIGGPKWLDTDRYDITAKTIGRITEKQEQPLLKDLLTDRFRLRTHTEKRELTVYGLEIAKNGLLVKPSQSQSSEIHNNRGLGKIQISVVNISIHQFAGMLGKQLGRIVVDKTGLTGGYDFSLAWDPEGQSETLPSLFAALQEQMGLKLESQKAMMDVLVVDSAEKASEN